MKRHIPTLILSLMLVFLAGCVSTPEKQRPKTQAPVSKQVLLVESSDVDRVLYEAWGEGNSLEAARKDAQKAALWAALFSGPEALLDTPEAKRKFASVAEKFYARAGDYVRYQSSPLAKETRSDGRVRMKYRVAIDVGQLRADLEEKGVLKATGAVNTQIGLPSVLVIPASAKAKIAANVLEQYLVDQGFTLVDKQANDKVARLTEKVARLSGQVDPMFLMAAKVGADVYIKTRASVQAIHVAGMTGKQASVQARAYETASGQLLGSATGYSEKRVDTSEDALIHEAANDTASRLTARLIRVWKQNAAKGVWYKLVVALEPAQAETQEAAVYTALQALKPTQVKRLRVGQHSVSYLVRLKHLPDSTALYYAFKKHYSGPGAPKRELAVGHLLILRLDSSEGEMQFD